MDERRALAFALDFVQPSFLILGDCQTGADRWAKIWGDRRGVPYKVLEADWNAHGRGAGPRRNQAMVDEEPDCAVVFPGGRGTKDCHERCVKNGIEVYDVKVTDA